MKQLPTPVSFVLGLIRLICLGCGLLLAGGCGGWNGGGLARIALLAPFEGRYTEVGYDAYYAVRLALHERGNDRIELLAIDDGGTTSSAIDRANALVRDPLVKAVIVLGQNAAQGDVQAAFGTLPVIIVGQWQSAPKTPHAFMLASKDLSGVVSSVNQYADTTYPPASDANVVGGELYALAQFPLLVKHRDTVTIASSGSLPDADFRQRYLSSAQYVPEPGLLATLAYDATGMILTGVETGTPLDTIDYHGVNGSIHFVDGYWADAPIHYYRYDSNGVLTPVDGSIK